jgi:hypothetical protein
MSSNRRSNCVFKTLLTERHLHDGILIRCFMCYLRLKFKIFQRSGEILLNPSLVNMAMNLQFLDVGRQRG